MGVGVIVLLTAFSFDILVFFFLVWFSFVVPVQNLKSDSESLFLCILTFIESKTTITMYCHRTTAYCYRIKMIMKLINEKR